MPRPKSFAPAAALDAALVVFHTKGYEAASIQDLVDATGLSRSSLYGTFGSKHALYLAALDRYRAAGQAATADALDGRDASPLCTIQRYLEAVADEQGEGGAPPLGCLMTNAAAEVASRDPETAQRAHAAAEHLTARFAQIVEQAQATGEVDSSRDAHTLGRFLANAVYGLRGLQKAGVEREQLRAVVRTTVDAIRT